MLANFTAQVNAEMKVGGVAETVEVTAETPIVDVQSAAVARAVTKDIIKEIPTGGTMYQLAAMMVGVTISGGRRSWTLAEHRIAGRSAAQRAWRRDGR